MSWIRSFKFNNNNNKLLYSKIVESIHSLERSHANKLNKKKHYKRKKKRKEMTSVISETLHIT